MLLYRLGDQRLFSNLPSSRHEDDNELGYGTEYDQANPEICLLFSFRNKLNGVENEYSDSSDERCDWGRPHASRAVEKARNNGHQTKGQAKPEGIWLIGSSLDVAPKTSPDDMEPEENG